MVALGLGNEHACNTATTNAVHLAAHWAIFVRKVRHDWRNLFWQQLLGHRAAEQCFGHTSKCKWGNGVCLDVVLRAFNGKHARETNKAHLCCAVICLAEVAENSSSR